MPVSEAAAFDEERVHAEEVGVVGHGEEVERRPGDPDVLAGRMRDRRALGELVRLVRCRADAAHERVVGVHGVDMKVAEEGLAIGRTRVLRQGACRRGEDDRKNGRGVQFHDHLSSGAYQIEELQARSWIVAARSGFGGMPTRRASQVDQRQLGFSRTRT